MLDATRGMRALGRVSGACALALCLLVGLSSVAVQSAQRLSAVDSGTIFGRVDVRRDLVPVARRPNVSSLGAMTELGNPEPWRSVVYLERVSRGAFEQP